MGLTEELKRAFESLKMTSAGGKNPVENVLISVDIPDTLDDFTGGKGDTDIAKEQKRVDDTIKKVKVFDRGNVGDLNRFTSQQFGNIRAFAQNPVGFIVQSVFKKFAKGVGVIAFALIIFEAVKFIISELLKPGRILDRRFKRVITDELIAFRQREDQQKLRQGFSNIIITTQPRLRGGQGQITNTLDLVRRGQFPDNIGQSPIILEASGVSTSKSKGRQRFRG